MHALQTDVRVTSKCGVDRLQGSDLTWSVPCRELVDRQERSSSCSLYYSGPNSAPNKIDSSGGICVKAHGRNSESPEAVERKTPNNLCQSVSVGCSPATFCSALSSVDCSLLTMSHVPNLCLPPSLADVLFTQLLMHADL